MKFKLAVILSIIFHISLLAIAIYMPDIRTKKTGTIYYVDLINMPGGGGVRGSLDTKKGDTTAEKSGASLVTDKSVGVKDLTVKKESQSKLRYPDKKIKKKKKKNIKKKKEEKLISVVRKERKRVNKQENNITVSRKGDSNILETGISSGIGSGSGTGSGSGSGNGMQMSPYAYYYETLRNKVSSSWYSSLVSPGYRGKFISTVYFKIFRNGNIKDLKLENSSGIESLDLSALRAVENASPFAPLPYDFPYQYLIVHFDFEWEK